MSKYIEIEGRRIGMDYVPVIVAELGINHNGSLEIAKRIVDKAYESGIEIIKHQTHIPSEEMSEEAKKAIPGNSKYSIYNIMERCALNEDEEIELKKYVESKNMIFISTPFSFAAVDRLERMNVSAYKIGSGEMNNIPLVEYIAKKNKPIIISTGMNSIESVKKTIEIVEKYHDKFAILHTTNIYPTPAHLVRLGALRELQETFPNEIIGLSDHTTNNYSSFAAISMGSSIVEKHFTDTRRRKGEDICCSMTPNQAKELIEFANEFFKMNTGKKMPSKEENVTINFAFSTVVTKKNIRKNEYFSLDNLTTKRPNVKDGIPASELYSLIGKRSNKDLNVNTHVKWNDIVDEK